MPDYIEELNESQRAAVLYGDGPSLVIAGAGSGKTRVLTYKIAYLLENGYNPWNILALTFTNKAAREMKERIARQVGEQRARFLWMGTFHSVFSRILRAEASHIGFTSQFTIYDSADSKSLIRSIIKEMGLDEKTYKPGSVQARISNAKNHLVSPSGYAANKEAYEGDLAAKMPAIRDIYSRYWERCRQAGAMDFDDLLVYTYILFRDFPDVLARYREQFRYVLVDEYQDTNYAQHSIVLQLTKENQRVCVVGDDAQSIYSFRGADIDNILYFTKIYPDTKVFKLEQNYRSTQSILNAANEVIRHNRGRKDKTLWTANDEGPKVRFRQYDTAYEEADAIIRDIEREKEEKNAEYSDFAVLYRTNAQSRLLEEKCIYYSIPYRLVGGVNFYQRKEIKDILCYLKTIANGRDDLAVQRVINVPKRGIGATSIGKVTIYASANGMSFYDALLRVRGVPTIGKAADKIEKFTEQIENFRSRLSALSIPELIEAILEETGYKKDLEAEGEIEGETRLQNVEELVNKATGYMSTAEEPTLDGFLEEVALVADVDSLDESENRIVLMTLHGAKGLEFPYVYLSGMEDGLFPSSMSIFSDDKDAIEEERRLCYVGITRAEKELTLTAARQRMVNGETRFAKVSRFIEEIPPQLLDEEEQPTVFERTAGMSRGRRGFEDSGTSGWTTGSFGVSGAGDGDRVRIGGMSGKHPLSENDAVWERGAARMSGWGGVNGSGSAGSSRTLDPYKSAYSSSSRPASPAPSFGKAFTVQKADHLSYGEGDRVRHLKFGEGTVQKIADGGKDFEVTVNFDRVGVKKMFASFAKLVKC